MSKTIHSDYVLQLACDRLNAHMYTDVYRLPDHAQNPGVLAVADALIEVPPEEPVSPVLQAWRGEMAKFYDSVGITPRADQYRRGQLDHEFPASLAGRLAATLKERGLLVDGAL